jgi:hypothetical protein
MDSNISPTTQKSWADLAANLANAIVPIAIGHLSSSPRKGLEGPDAVAIDAKSFASILGSVFTTALPIVAQSLAATSKDFAPTPDDKGFVDRLTHAVSTIVRSPVARAALEVAPFVML